MAKIRFHHLMHFDENIAKYMYKATSFTTLTKIAEHVKNAKMGNISDKRI